tara:strand:- start:664 stop:1017 length:354 start_codon:yes stop_codon:yes gene_type:complete
MIIFPNTDISWGGKEYTTKVTMRLINKIEQTVSLAPLAMKLQSGDVVLSHLAVIYGNLLRSGGCDVSDDEVYASMMGVDVDSKLDQSEVITAAATALTCCFPERPEDEEPKKKAGRK